MSTVPVEFESKSYPAQSTGQLAKGISFGKTFSKDMLEDKVTMVCALRQHSHKLFEKGIASVFSVSYLCCEIAVELCWCGHSFPYCRRA